MGEWKTMEHCVPLNRGDERSCMVGDTELRSTGVDPGDFLCKNLQYMAPHFSSPHSSRCLNEM